MSFCRPARPPRVTPLPFSSILLLDKTPGRWTDSPFESFPPPFLVALSPPFLLLSALCVSRAAPRARSRSLSSGVLLPPLRYSSPYTPTLFLYLAPLCTTPRSCAPVVPCTHPFLFLLTLSLKSLVFLVPCVFVLVSLHLSFLA